MQNVNNTTVTTTNNTHVKHNAYVSAMQAQAQNKRNAHLYTSAQHAHAIALMQALQKQYVSKTIYKNARNTMLTVSVSNTTQICSNLLNIAKQFKVVNVKLTKTAIILQVV
jgi:hypothetical protein